MDVVVCRPGGAYRESVGAFQADDMLDLTALVAAAAKSGSDALRAYLLPPDTALEAMPAVQLDAAGHDRFVAGQVIASSTEDGSNGLVRVYGADEEFIGVGDVSVDGQLAPRRVFRIGEKKP